MPALYSYFFAPSWFFDDYITVFSLKYLRFGLACKFKTFMALGLLAVREKEALFRVVNELSGLIYLTRPLAGELEE